METSNETEVRPVPVVILYILMRSDLASMNAGKAIAQGSHAANAAAVHASNIYPEMYIDWAGSTNQSFGTAIVLDGGSMDYIEDFLAQIGVKKYVQSPNPQMVVADTIFDPTYPLRDGLFTHHIPIKTCAYIMCYKDSVFHKMVRDSSMPLYN